MTKRKFRAAAVEIIFSDEITKKKRQQNGTYFTQHNRQLTEYCSFSHKKK